MIFFLSRRLASRGLCPGRKHDPDSGYQSRYSHEEETASAGYYKVKLLKSGVTVELTAGERAGMMRMTFPASENASILTDLSHVLTGKKWKVIWSHVRIENKSTVTGFHLVNGWAKERSLYFAARFSRPFDKAEIMSDGKPVSTTPIASAARRKRREPIFNSSPITKPAKTRRSSSRWPSQPSAPRTP